MDPTLTPSLNPWFSIIFLFFIGGAFIVEIIGIRRRGKDGDTITENWRWIEAWLPDNVAWLFRIITGGILVWAILHFLAGAP